MADVTLSYKGSDILELSDSGSATLKTGGKYCEDDVTVEYVKPSGGGSLPLPVTKITTGTLVLASDATEVTITHNLGVRPSLFYFAPYALDVNAIRQYNKGKAFSYTYSNITNIGGATGARLTQYSHATSGNLLHNADSQLWVDVKKDTIKFSSYNSSTPFACQYYDSSEVLHDITWLWVAVAIDWGL